MTWRNTPQSFGIISRVLHWGMAALLIGQIALGLRVASLEPGLSTLWLYGLHKTIGLTALGLVLLRVLWHFISPPPRPLSPSGLLLWAARLGHLALYGLMLAIPLSGWVASSASGLDVVFADRWTLPAIAPVSAALEAQAFAAHAILGKLLAALVGVHVLAAIGHEMKGDGTLTRMLQGRRKT